MTFRSPTTSWPSLSVTLSIDQLVIVLVLSLSHLKSTPSMTSSKTWVNFLIWLRPTLVITSGVTTLSSSFLHPSQWVAWKTPSSPSPHPPSSLETSPKSMLPPMRWLTAGLVTLSPAKTGKASGLTKAGLFSLKEKSVLLFMVKISLWLRPFWATTLSGLIWSRMEAKAVPTRHSTPFLKVTTQTTVSQRFPMKRDSNSLPT